MTISNCELPPEAVPEKRGEFVSRWIADELLIVPICATAADADSIYTLNSVGGHVWELVDGVRNIGNIAQEIAREYGVTEEEALKDVMEFLEQLQSANLVKPSA